MHLPSPTLPALLLTLLAGCGFQLRGSVDLPDEWQSVCLLSDSPNSELARAVRAGFERNGVAVTDCGEAGFRLRLGGEQFQRRNLAISGNARATEFDLTMTATLQVSDRDGETLLADTELSARRVMTHDPEQVAGKEGESRLLQADMRRTLAAQVLRRVRFLSTPSTGDR